MAQSVAAIAHRVGVAALASAAARGTHGILAEL